MIIYLHVFKVAPLVGAWIEISLDVDSAIAAESLPLWERGLKLEAWHGNNQEKCRSPCGSVD